MKHFVIISFLLMLITSYFSVGCYHSDEYGQILEFVHYKMGKVPASHMPWEFAERMRPWLQPAIYYTLARVIPVSDPFTQSFLFRLFSGVVAWLSTIALASCLPVWFRTEKWRKFALYCLAFSFFIPMFQVRTSSENFSACMLVFAVALITRRGFTKKSGPIFWAIGFLLGLAFDFRYQSAFAGIGLIFWLLFVARISLRSFLKVILGGVLALLVSAGVDYWGYGEWVIAPWNYYYQNIVLGLASKWFGSSPWWYWFVIVFEFVIFPLGLFVLVLIPSFWMLYPSHILTLPTVLFVLGHMLVGHKEFRFLFPIAYFVPVMMVLAIERIAEFREFGSKWIFVLRGFYRLGLCVNFLLLFYFCLNPQRNHLIFLKTFVSTFPEVRELYWQAEEKLDPHYFYFPHGAKVVPVGAFSEITSVEEFYYYRRISQSQSRKDPVSAKCSRVYLDLVSQGIEADISAEFLKKASPIRHELYRCAR